MSVTTTKKEEGHPHEFLYSLLRRTLGPLVRSIWIKEVKGIDNIPSTGAAIIAFNHSSYFDFICFMAVSPRNIHYLAAEKFFNNFWWRLVMRLTGQIRVERKHGDKRGVHDTVFKHLEEGKLVGVFPEGTRSPHGEMLPVFRGVALYAIKSDTPVVPVGIVGAYAILSRYSRFPTLSKKVSLRIGPPIFSQAFFGGIKFNKDAQQLLAEKIMGQIALLCDTSYPYKSISAFGKERDSQVVVFDLDGTLIKGQSQKYFAKYLYRIGIISGVDFLAALIWFAGYRIGIIDDPGTAMNKFYSFLKGKDPRVVDEIARDFFNKELKAHINMATASTLGDHRKLGRRILIASNAPEFIVKCAAEFLKASDYLATKFEISSGVYTGRVTGDLMYNINKSKAVSNFIATQRLNHRALWVYTDHISDLPLLEIAKNKIVVNPDRKLAKLANKLKWKTIYTS